MADATLELINQSVRDRFEMGWLRGSPESIETLLADPTADGYLPTLEELVRVDMEQSWLLAQGGQGVRPVVEDYVERFPLLREPDRLLRLVRREEQLRSSSGMTIATERSIRERFPELHDHPDARALEETVSPGASAETVVDPIWSRPALPELGDFGDYELLDQLGAGGMGVVYRARQKGADRVVALKVVHAERQAGKSGDQRSKVAERFQVEARAAAQLDHENIVPVYDVGEVGDKLYFSMRLVEGQSLNEMVDEQPLEPRRAADYLRGVARGVHAAHEQGILHRDLKPHNVMVDARDDRPLVADFGLAKVVEADDQITRSGEVIGTPSYMSPEQVSHANQVGPSADIYALGATLYHLLTGRPPFKGPSTMATLQQVLFQDAVEPLRLDEKIDRDLNTICMKCLEKEPERRYASADLLAKDLERYLQGRPISARPISSTERAVRWSKRNPLSASLLGLAGLLAGLVFAAVAVGYQQTSAALTVAEHNYEIARESVDSLYTDVAGVDLENAPGMQPLKEKLLRRSLIYYQRLLDERTGDSGLNAEYAANHFRVGSILLDLADGAGAANHFQTAADDQQRLLAATPDDPDLRLQLSNSLNELARAKLRTGDLEAAGEAFDRARELRAELLDGAPTDRELRRKLASIDMNLGLLSARGGDLQAARAKYDTAQKERHELIAAEATPDVARDFAKGDINLGVLEARQERFGPAAERFRSAIARYEALLADEPASLSHQYSLGVAQFLLADVLRLAGDQPGAAKAFDEAEAYLRAMVDENPKVEAYQQELSRQQIGRAQLELEQGQQRAAEADAAASQRHYEQAERTLQAAADRLGPLVERSPDAVDYRYDLSIVLQMLGDIQLAFSDPAAAAEHWQAALANLEGQPADGDFAALRDSIRQSLQEVLSTE